jgi:hypothetical protein
VFNVKSLVASLILLAALLVACGPTGAEPEVEEPAATPTTEVPQPTAETPTGEMPPVDGSADATAAAVSFLAGYLGVAEEEIQVVSVVPTEFSDSCLGLGQANESCLQAITPGYVVTLSAGDQPFTLHTDATGQQVRLAAQLEGAEGAPADPAAAEAAAVAFLAGELGVDAGEIEVVALEGAEFTDSCLGLGQANELCAQVMTPGWQFTLSAGGQEYEVRTDATGQVVRVAGQTE